MTRNILLMKLCQSVMLITHNLVVKRGLLAYESKLMGRPVVSGREKKSLLNDSQYFAYEIMPKCDANYT